MQFRLFIRLVKRHWEIFGLKILTLAIAFACSILIVLFAIHEFTYDSFHQDASSIVRILERNENDTFSGNRYSGKIPDSVCRSIKSNLQKSLVAASIRTIEKLTITSPEVQQTDQRITVSDGGIINILSFSVIDGSSGTFQSKELSILLSATQSLRYFNSTKATGKSLAIIHRNDTLRCTVAAVFEDFPSNSHQTFDFIVHMNNAHLERIRFSTQRAALYARLIRSDISATENALRKLFKKSGYTYLLQRLPDIYLGRRVTEENVRHGDAYSVSILLGITGLILFLSVTTYINLTTLTLPGRAKELAMRKVAGAGNLHLLLIFFRESLGINAVAFLLGLTLVILASGFLIPFLEIDFFVLIKQAYLILGLIIGVIFLTVSLAPMIVALKFTAVAPNRLLGSETLTFPAFKKMISFFQLGISLFLIVGSLIVKRQINRSLIKEPGHNHYQVLVVPFPRNMSSEGLYNLKKNWKNTNPHIIDVVAVSHLPNNLSGKEIGSDFFYLKTDPDFLTFFGLKSVSGKLSAEAPETVLLNEEGFKNRSTIAERPVGVVQNFGSIFDQPDIALKIKSGQLSEFNFLCIRVLEVNIRNTIHQVAKFVDVDPATITFFDPHFTQRLSYENKLNTLSEILAVVSAALSCCAIYGLSISLARDKAKQIAIHKISGASTRNIIAILVYQFIKPIGLALFFFGPLSFLFITEWLRGFAYATSINVLDAIIALGFCSAIVLLTCSYQALKLDRVSLSSAIR
jgi:hypothetical protein